MVIVILWHMILSTEPLNFNLSVTLSNYWNLGFTMVFHNYISVVTETTYFWFLLAIKVLTLVLLKYISKYFTYQLLHNKPP